MTDRTDQEILDGMRADVARQRTVDAINGAYAEHMKTLFGAFVRHLPNIASARAEFRKGLDGANQARSEMVAIAKESDG